MYVHGSAKMLAHMTMQMMTSNQRVPAGLRPARCRKSRQNAQRSKQSWNACILPLEFIVEKEESALNKSMQFQIGDTAQDVEKKGIFSRNQIKKCAQAQSKQRDSGAALPQSPFCWGSCTLTQQIEIAKLQAVRYMEERRNTDIQHTTALLSTPAEEMNNRIDLAKLWKLQDCNDSIFAKFKASWHGSDHWLQPLLKGNLLCRSSNSKQIKWLTEPLSVAAFPYSNAKNNRASLQSPQVWAASLLALLVVQMKLHQWLMFRLHNLHLPKLKLLNWWRARQPWWRWQWSELVQQQRWGFYCSKKRTHIRASLMVGGSNMDFRPRGIKFGPSSKKQNRQVLWCHPEICALHSSSSLKIKIKTFVSSINNNLFAMDDDNMMAAAMLVPTQLSWIVPWCNQIVLLSYSDLTKSFSFLLFFSFSRQWMRASRPSTFDARPISFATQWRGEQLLQ